MVDGAIFFMALFNNGLYGQYADVNILGVGLVNYHSRMCSPIHNLNGVGKLALVPNHLLSICS